MAVKEDLSGAVREYAARHYVHEAKRSGAPRFEITAGEVHKALGFHNRVPVVCSALRSEKFLRENGLKLVKTSGPPSGLSTTSSFTYEFDPQRPESDHDEAMRAFDSIRGLLKEEFTKVGGGEAFLRAERAAWGKEPVDYEHGKFGR